MSGAADRTDPKQRVIDYYNQEAAAYVQQYELPPLEPEFYPANAIRLEILVRRLRERGVRTLLDIGCGSGGPLLRFLREGWDAVGFDFSPEMVNAARRGLEEAGHDPARVRVADLEKAETLPAGAFDAVIATGVFPHNLDDAAAYANLRSAVAPQGVALVEYRNALMALFSLNRYSEPFFWHDLLGADDLPADLREATRGFLAGKFDTPVASVGRPRAIEYADILALPQPADPRPRAGAARSRAESDSLLPLPRGAAGVRAHAQAAVSRGVAASRASRRLARSVSGERVRRGDRARMIDRVPAWLERCVDLQRSLVSEGYDTTLAAIEAEAGPGFRRYTFPSGSEAFTWVVPPRWIVREARIIAAGANGTPLVDAADHPLHLVTHSAPFRGRVSRDELLRHLHTDPARPERIPYVYRFYSRKWGFCLPHRWLDRFTAAEYDVVVDTELQEQGR